MRKLLMVAVAGLLAACGGSDDAGVVTPTTQANVTGTYTLATVNGNPLPFITQQDANLTAKMTSAQFVFSSAGTWTQAQVYQITSNGSTSTSTINSSGTFKLTGSTLNMTQTSGSGGTFTLTTDATASALVLADPGYTFVYRRQ